MRAAFVEAYPLYVATVLTARGVEMIEVIADGIVEGVSVLDGLLQALEGSSFELQRQSPLELFREALRPIGRALDTAGVPPPAGVRAGAVSLVAWDVHMLSPASSAELGSTAHEAHLRWGLAKARAMGAFPSQTARTSVLAWCAPQDRRVIEEQVIAAGYEMSDQRTSASFAVVDSDTDTFVEDLEDAMRASKRTVVYGRALDDVREAGLRAQGVWKIATRQKMLTDLAAVLPQLV
jgi:hypothetical protein